MFLNTLKPSGNYMYRQFNSQQFYVLPTQTVFMCFVCISEQTAIISLYSINWLVCITEMECVYRAVRTGCIDINQVALRLKTVNGHYAVLVFRQCHWMKNKLIKTYKVTLSGVRATTLVVEKHWISRSLSVSARNLRYPVRNAHALYYIVIPGLPPLFKIFSHYLMNGTIF